MCILNQSATGKKCKFRKLWFSFSTFRSCWKCRPCFKLGGLPDFIHNHVIESVWWGGTKILCQISQSCAILNRTFTIMSQLSFTNVFHTQSWSMESEILTDYWQSINCLPSPTRVNASSLGIHPLFSCHPSMRPLNKSNFGSGLWGLEAWGCLGIHWITTLSGLQGNSLTFIRTGLCIASYKSRLHWWFCAFLSFPVRQRQIFHFLMMSSGICWWHNEGK